MKKELDTFSLLTRDDVRKYISTWKRKKSKKYLEAVDRAAQELAVEMFMDMVKELERARKSVGL